MVFALIFTAPGKAAFRLAIRALVLALFAKEAFCFANWAVFAEETLCSGGAEELLFSANWAVFAEASGACADGLLFAEEAFCSANRLLFAKPSDCSANWAAVFAEALAFSANWRWFAKPSVS
ncbi:MAG: hypothetical protein IIT45_09190, partial [Treponema sp.]|nr:hypothetical protein [Treponema sp.]